MESRGCVMGKGLRKGMVVVSWQRCIIQSIKLIYWESQNEIVKGCSSTEKRRDWMLRIP